MTPNDRGKDMQSTWEINASPLLVQLRPRNVRLAAEIEPHIGQTPSSPDHDKSIKAREELAYARGRLDGERMAAEQLRRREEELRGLREKALEPLRGAVSHVVRDTEQSVVALAIQVAERLVGEMPVSREMVEGAVREALQQMKETAECHIYLHPEDLQLLGDSPSQLDQPSPLHFHASNDVARGGCIVKTSFGTIDGQRHTKTEQLRRTLLS